MSSAEVKSAETVVENVQRAPFPTALDDLVCTIDYKDGWEFTLEDDLDRGQGSRGLTLCILISTPDSYNPDRVTRVMHYFPVPPAAYDERSWRRWLFDQVLLVERHEAMEFFRFGQNDRPFAPSHGPGNDPYMIRELGSVVDQKTSFRGELNP